MNRHKYHQQGFTIVEALVTAAVFAIILGVTGAVFVQMVNAQRRARAAQNVQENLQFVLETVAREIRVSAIDPLEDDVDNTTGICSGDDALNDSLVVTHPVNGTVTYAYDKDTGILSRTAGTGTVGLNSPDAKFSRFDFCVEAPGVGNSGDPDEKKLTRVTILGTIESSMGIQTVSVNFQTTVVGRDFSNELPATP